MERLKAMCKKRKPERERGKHELGTKERDLPEGTGNSVSRKKVNMGQRERGGESER